MAEPDSHVNLASMARPYLWEKVLIQGLAVWNTNVSSSATRKIGAPPVEMETAFARVSFAPSVAAHACKAEIEGKWISAIRSKGAAPPCAEPNTLVATILVLPASLLIAMDTC